MRSNEKKRAMVGTVVSDKMDKAITLQYEERKRHPLYKKFVKKHKKIKVRDAKNEAAVGDRVRVIETRKLTKEIHWKLVEIIEKAQKG